MCKNVVHDNVVCERSVGKKCVKGLRVTLLDGKKLHGAKQLLIEGKPLFIEGILETKDPTICTDEKHSQEEAKPGRNSDVEKVTTEKIRGGESQKREDAGARKGRKVAKHCVLFTVMWLRRVEK